MERWWISARMYAIGNLHFRDVTRQVNVIRRTVARARAHRSGQAQRVKSLRLPRAPRTEFPGSFRKATRCKQIWSPRMHGTLGTSRRKQYSFVLRCRKFCTEQNKAGRPMMSKFSILRLSPVAGSLLDLKFTFAKRIIRRHLVSISFLSIYRSWLCFSFHLTLSERTTLKRLRATFDSITFCSFVEIALFGGMSLGEEKIMIKSMSPRFSPFFSIHSI